MSTKKDQKSINKVPKHLAQMETILSMATIKLDALEAQIEELRDYQTEIAKLEEYYTSEQWKEDLALDEAGKLPADLKRGVLSEDGIYNLLERNKELMELIGKE